MTSELDTFLYRFTSVSHNDTDSTITDSVHDRDFYRSLIEGMEEGVLVQGADGTVLIANASLLRTLKMTEDEIRRGEFKVLHEDGHPVEKEELPFNVTLRTGIPLSGVILGLVRLDQDIAWVSVATRPLQKPGKQPHGVMVTFREITALRVTEKLLRESETKLRSFITEAPVGLMMTSDGQSCVFANHTWCTITGLTFEECFGTNWTNTVHKDDSLNLRSPTVLRKTPFEARFMRSDGSVVTALLKCVELQDGVGKRTGYLWTAVDITERKAAQEERDRFFALSLDLLCTANIDGYFTRVNPAFTQTLGYTPEELYSKTIIDLVHPEDKLDTQEELVKLLNGYESVSFETRVQTKQNEWRWLSWKCPKPVNGSLYAVARDITEKRMAQEALRRMAHTDQLTGLRNRPTLMAQLSAKVLHAEQSGSEVSVLFIDLDEFKQVNDLYGHDAGDLVIKEVGARLTSCVRRTDMVARLGGDEYVVVLENATTESAEQVAQKILAHVAEPFTLPGGQVVLPQASIGISSYPEDGLDPESLIKAADKAMYSSKRAGGHRCR